MNNTLTNTTTDKEEENNMELHQEYIEALYRIEAKLDAFTERVDRVDHQLLGNGRPGLLDRTKSLEEKVEDCNVCWARNIPTKAIWSVIGFFALSMVALVLEHSQTIISLFK